MASGPKEFFADPAAYFSQDFFLAIRAQILAGMIPRAEGLSILDLGCGDGRLSLAFANRATTVTLVDQSPAMVELATAGAANSRQPAEIQVVCQDVAAFEPGRQFDVVLCMGLVAHLPSLDVLTTLLSRHVRSGGLAIVQWTESDSLLGRLAYWQERLRRRWTRARWYAPLETRGSVIEEHLGRAGFTVEARDRYGVLVPGAGSLPNGWLLNWERFVRRRPWLRRAGADAVVAFRRA